MGYLNNATVTVDAILTKKGRELLARGASAFNITQFALADDEIDYDLWNQSHPLGDDKMGTVIENLPITEAVPDETQSMKYKLITLSEGTKAIPYIEADRTSLVLRGSTGARNLSANDRTANLTIELKQWSSTGQGPLTITENPGGYTFTMLDTTYLTILKVFEFTPIQLPMSGKSVTWNSPTDVVPKLSFVIGINGNWPDAQIDGKSTKLIITNTRYGSRIVIPISYSIT